MKIFNKNEGTVEHPSFNEQLKQQADKLGLKVEDLKKLAEGKSCPKYGTKEILHTRKVRGGTLVVFNISEKYRGEKISTGRKKNKELKR